MRAYCKPSCANTQAVKNSACSVEAAAETGKITAPCADKVCRLCNCAAESTASQGAITTGRLVANANSAMRAAGDWGAPLAIKAKLPPRAAGTTTAFKAKGYKC